MIISGRPQHFYEDEEQYEGNYDYKQNEYRPEQEGEYHTQETDHSMVEGKLADQGLEISPIEEGSEEKETRLYDTNEEELTTSQPQLAHDVLNQDESHSGLLEIAQARHIDMMLTGFMERLFMREKLTGLQDTLT